MNIKKTLIAISEKKTELRRKALILGGTAVGIVIAYAYLSKSNAENPDVLVYEEEVVEIIEQSKDTE